MFAQETAETLPVCCTVKEIVHECGKGDDHGRVKPAEVCM